MTKFNVLKDVVLKSIDDFNKNDSYLLENNHNERSWYPLLGTYIINNLSTTEYNDYVFDTEYNRGMNGDNAAIKQLDEKNISIDLIIHKRGYNEITGYDNLICIECKKSTNLTDIDEDKTRLEKLTSYNDKFNYSLGVMIVGDKLKNKLEVNEFFELH